MQFLFYSLNRLSVQILCKRNQTTLNVARDAQNLPAFQKEILVNTGTVLLIIIGVILFIALLLLLVGGLAMSRRTMMGGLLATPIGWGAFMVVFILGGILSYAAIY